MMITWTGRSVQSFRVVATGHGCEAHRKSPANRLGFLDFISPSTAALAIAKDDGLS